MAFRYDEAGHMEYLSFHELFAPVGSHVFLDSFLQKRLHLTENPDRKRLEYLFPWQTLNELLRSAQLAKGRFRVIRDGRDIPGMFYEKSGKPGTIDPVRLKAVTDQGASFVLNGVQQLIPEIRWLAQEIELSLGERINVNAYFSFGQGGAFQTHYDSHDVLVLQIHGSKQWEILDAPEEYPLREKKITISGTRKIVLNTVLQAGSVLYVPRGVYHRAAVDDTVEDTVSVHLTFGIHTRKGVDFANWLQERASKDPLFRQDLPLTGGSEHAAQYERQLKDRLIQMIEKVSIADFVAEGNRRREPSDSFVFGPPPEIEGDSLLRALVKREAEPGIAAYRGHRTEGMTSPMQKVLEAVLRKRVVGYGELLAELAGTMSEADLRAASEALMARSLIEVTARKQMLPVMAEKD